MGSNVLVRNVLPEWCFEISGAGVLGQSFAPVVLSTAASGPAGHHNGWRGRALTEPAARIEAVDLTSGDVT